jgi:hypothetical protein
VNSIAASVGRNPTLPDYEDFIVVRTAAFGEEG